LNETEGPKVIPFSEKHYAKVIQENIALKARLRDLLTVAQTNQQIQDHLEVLERKLLKSRSLREMVQIIVREIKRRFHVDHVTLCLALDPGDVLRKAQGSTKKSASIPAHLRITEPRELKAALPKQIRGPLLRGKIKQPPGPFFPEDALAEIGSHAVVPLFLSKELIGTLNLGSRDSQRYRAGIGTDFLRRLGTKISLVIDNILVHERLVELSETDPLTGVSNRRHFGRVLTQEVLRAERYDTPLVCMVLDLDGFKLINDQFGHETGDEALKHVAALFQKHSRRNDVVARYGGDEFAVLLPHTRLESALGVADRYQRNLDKFPFSHNEKPLSLKLSIGLTALPETSVKTPEDLVKEADRRLFIAKTRGGGQVVSSSD
jgi:diguanylate cyclase (GGDEF)-like protein